LGRAAKGAKMLDYGKLQGLEVWRGIGSLTKLEGDRGQLWCRGVVDYVKEGEEKL